jgi:hypothetical protein
MYIVYFSFLDLLSISDRIYYYNISAARYKREIYLLEYTLQTLVRILAFIV